MSGLNGFVVNSFISKKQESVPFTDGEIMLSSFLGMAKRIRFISVE